MWLTHLLFTAFSTFKLQQQGKYVSLFLSIMKLPQLPALCVLCHTGLHLWTKCFLPFKCVSQANVKVIFATMNSADIQDWFSVCNKSSRAFLYVLKTWIEEKKNNDKEHRVSLQFGSIRTITCLVRNMITTGRLSISAPSNAVSSCNLAKHVCYLLNHSDGWPSLTELDKLGIIF